MILTPKGNEQKSIKSPRTLKTPSISVINVSPIKIEKKTSIDEEKTQSLSCESSIRSISKSQSVNPARSVSSNLEVRTTTLLTSMEFLGVDNEVECETHHTPDSMCQVFVQSFLPFITGGFGSILAGLLLTYANRSMQLLKDVPEFLALMPPLQGLKGNLDMTFSARMSTLSHTGAYDRPGITIKILRNIAVMEAQSISVSLFADVTSFVMMIINPNAEMIIKIDHNSTIETSMWNDFLFLGSSACISIMISCIISNLLLSAMVGLTRRHGFNPDNIVIPLGSSLADFLTIASMLLICSFFRILIHDSVVLPIIIITIAVLSIPFWIYLARKDQDAMKTAKQQFITLILATIFSCFGGYIQSIGAIEYPNYPAYQTLISGLTGNRCAVQASRISSYLEIHKKSELEFRERLSPYSYFMSSSSESQTARLLLLTSIPFQSLFLFISTFISILVGVSTEISYIFFIGYLFTAFIQVFLIMFYTQLLVIILWKIGLDPDIHAIPALTSAADVGGCGLLYLLFLSIDRGFGCVLKNPKIG